MESLAQASGDIEQLVAVMSRDLSSAYSYWKIAEVYREARQHDNALLWAEKGLKTFPDHTDGRLREFAAEEYHRRRRHDDAMKLVWAEFSERPSSSKSPRRFAPPARRTIHHPPPQKFSRPRPPGSRWGWVTTAGSIPR